MDIIFLWSEITVSYITEDTLDFIITHLIWFKIAYIIFMIFPTCNYIIDRISGSDLATLAFPIYILGWLGYMAGVLCTYGALVVSSLFLLGLTAIFFKLFPVDKSKNKSDIRIPYKSFINFYILKPSRYRLLANCVEDLENRKNCDFTHYDCMYAMHYTDKALTIPIVIGFNFIDTIRYRMFKAIEKEETFIHKAINKYKQKIKEKQEIKLKRAVLTQQYINSVKEDIAEHERISNTKIKQAKNGIGQVVNNIERGM